SSAALTLPCAPVSGFEPGPHWAFGVGAGSAGAGAAVVEANAPPDNRSATPKTAEARQSLRMREASSPAGDLLLLEPDALVVAALWVEEQGDEGDLEEQIEDAAAQKTHVVGDGQGE